VVLFISAGVFESLRRIKYRYLIKALQSVQRQKDGREDSRVPVDRR
jgi:hypothetical protein